MQKLAPLYYIERIPQTYQYIFLFIHGNRSSHAWFNPTIDAMFTMNPNIRTLQLDLRGYGQSQQINEVDSIENFSNDVHNLVLNILSENIFQKCPLIVIGWSLGGMVTMNLAATYPNIYKNIFLLSSGPISGFKLYKQIDGVQTNEVCQTKEDVLSLKQIQEAEKAAKEKNYDYYFGLADTIWFNSGLRPSQDQLKQYFEESMKQTNYGQTAWAIHKYDLRPKKDQITGPVKIFQGGLDKIILQKHADEIYHEIGPNKCSMIINPNIGHMGPLEAPQELADELLKFASQV